MTKFLVNMEDTFTLLTMSKSNQDPANVLILLKSSIVISIAYWERFIEDLLLEGCQYISEGLRNPLDLPTITKQKIALFSVIDDRSSNPEGFSRSIWSFSGEGWTKNYTSYVTKLTEKLNTADTRNINELFDWVFGIKSILNNWNSPNSQSGINCKQFDEFVNKRHQIAHGSDSSSSDVNIRYLYSRIDLLIELAKYIWEVTWEQIASIVRDSAKTYSLKSKYIFDIINYFGSHGSTSINRSILNAISSTAYGNHKKLGYKPWSLLEIENRTTIKPTENLFRFLKNEISLPQKIYVLKNDMAFPVQNCENITYSELEKRFRSKANSL